MNFVSVQATIVLILDSSEAIVSLKATIFILIRIELYVATEQKDGLLVDVTVFHDCLLIISQPRIALEAHEAILIISLHQEHDVAVCFFDPSKQLLLDHLCVIDEADKLPLTEVYYPLWHSECHVNDCNLLVSRTRCFVSK